VRHEPGAIIQSQCNLDDVPGLELGIRIGIDAFATFFALSDDGHLRIDLVCRRKQRPRCCILELLGSALQLCPKLGELHAGILEVLKQLDPTLVIQSLQLPGHFVLLFFDLHELCSRLQLAGGREQKSATGVGDARAGQKAFCRELDRALQLLGVRLRTLLLLRFLGGQDFDLLVPPA
jgi:hypothetical protein